MKIRYFKDMQFFEDTLILDDLLIFEDLDKQGLRLSEISQKTDIKPNTLHNLLRTMIDKDYIQQYENIPNSLL